MDEQPVAIYTAANPEQAFLLKIQLAEAGIDAFVTLAQTAGELPIGWITAPRVLVPAQQATQARALAEEFDRRVREDHQLETSGETTDDAGRDWPEWPRCPLCGERCPTECPACHTTGTEFPLADTPNLLLPDHGPTEPHQAARLAADRRAQILLLCPTCDEPFQPRFYEHCARCGHDFQHGVEAEDTPLSDIPPRAVALIAGVLFGCFVLIAYFWWLLRIAH